MGAKPKKRKEPKKKVLKKTAPIAKAKAAPKKTVKKPRSGHRIGKGYIKPEKDLLGLLYNRCVEFHAGTYKKKLGTAKDLFHFLTEGISVTSAKSAGRLKKKGQEIPEKAKPGPAQCDIDDRMADFHEWVADKVAAAKQGGFLTLRRLRDDLKTEKNLSVSMHVLRRTLRKLGFRYVSRDGKWISRRQEPHIQKRLRAFLDYAVKNSELVNGKYVWTIPAAFQDESFLYEAVFRSKSWCGKDKTYDKKKKGDGPRVNLIHCIFTHLPEQPTKDNGRPECLVAYKSTWTGKRHEFKGNCTGDDIERYFHTRVFEHIKSGGVVFVDNAGTHRAFLEDITGFDQDELVDYIQERMNKFAPTKKDKKEKNAKWKLTQDWEELCKDSIPYKPEKKVLRAFIRENHLQDTNLREAAKTWEATVNYLPQYHPECNPIERYWALLKRYYYDSDPTLPWSERLKVALERIPSDYIDKCIQKSLVWIHKRHEALKAADALNEDLEAAQGEDEVEVEDNEDDDSEDEDDDDDEEEESDWD
jgi:transposase